MQLSDALERFAEELAVQRKSPRTIEAYVGSTSRILEPFEEGWASVSMIKALQRWRQSLQKHFVAGTISDAKIRLDIAALRSFYAVAESQGWCKKNLADKLSSFKRKTGLPRPMPVDHVQRLMQAVGITPESGSEQVRDRAILELFLNGLRNSEVVGLQVQGLEWDVQEGTFVARFTGKGGNEAEVVLKPEIAAFMSWMLLQRFNPQWKAQLAERSEESVMERFLGLWKQTMESLPPAAKETPVFLWKGRAFRRQEINRLFHRYRKLAKLPNTYGPHTLRHTCGTEMLRRGADLRTVQEVLRHKHISQTQLYTKVERETKSTAARLLPAFGGFDST